jgi:hypothetical protein
LFAGSGGRFTKLLRAANLTAENTKVLAVIIAISIGEIKDTKKKKRMTVLTLGVKFQI